MATELEEIQAKEFLKRAEIKTMKKDLRALREVDALSERDKIAKIKTLEEQRLEQEKKLGELEQAKAEEEKKGREKILSENVHQEKLAEKDLKEYATEQERQQIFLFESQRLAFEKQIEEIDNKKDPAFKLEKNTILLQKRGWDEKLNVILEQEKKLEDEQNFLNQKAQTSTIPSEKKGLEQRRWDVEKEIQEIEKKRWAIEKELETIETKVAQIDKSSGLLVTERNDLNQKVLGVDKSLREIYSVIIERVQVQRKEKLGEQALAKEELAKARAGEKERVQREQWNPTENLSVPTKNKVTINVPSKKRVIDVSGEEEQRKKFMQNIESWAGEKDKIEKQSQTNEGLIPPKKI